MSLVDTPITSGAFKIVEEHATDNGDPVFTKEELNNMSYQMLRLLAANANTSVINGKSNQLQIKAYYGRQTTFKDYSKG